MSRRGVFIDRDGTLNEERDFLKDPEDLILVEGAGEAIRKLNENGIPVFVISNQSGVARGLLSEQDLQQIHSRLRRELERHHAHVDAISYCPHHPTAGEPPYRSDCDCRKPKTGMIDDNARAFGIDLSRSFVIGDKLIDIQAGENAGATTILVLTGYGTKSFELSEREGVTPDQVADNLPGAIEYVLERIHLDDGEKR